MSWAFLIFGGVVGALPVLGFPAPSVYWEKSAAYLTALGLVIFIISYFMLRLFSRPAAGTK
jgi:hypothetical protein